MPAAKKFRRASRCADTDPSVTQHPSSDVVNQLCASFRHHVMNRSQKKEPQNRSPRTSPRLSMINRRMNVPTSFCHNWVRPAIINDAHRVLVCGCRCDREVPELRDVRCSSHGNASCTFLDFFTTQAFRINVLDHAITQAAITI